MNRRQQRFVEEYLVDLNATQAAIRAGYSEKTAYSVGNENLSKPEIKSAIDAEMARRSQATAITAERVLKELAKVAFFDKRKLFDTTGQFIPPNKWDAELGAVVTSFEHGPAGLQKVKIADKLDALQLIGRHLGMFRDKVEVTGQVHTSAPGPDLSRLTDDQLAQLETILSAAAPEPGRGAG